MQLSIARRGAAMLKVGGRLVYSTCSMNPIEDEAVVAQLLRESEGTLRLCDAHPLLPKLIGLRGVSTFLIETMISWYDKPSDVPEQLRKMICESMRIVPHHQDTGGFFVALLEKVEEKPLDSPVVVGAPAYKKQKMFKDEPFTFLKKDDERWHDIKYVFGSGLI
ncbi:hypothetical protein COOONC_22978 [Cooperia oncophora]